MLEGDYVLEYHSMLYEHPSGFQLKLTEIILSVSNYSHFTFFFALGLLCSQLTNLIFLGDEIKFQFNAILFSCKFVHFDL